MKSHEISRRDACRLLALGTLALTGAWNYPQLHAAESATPTGPFKLPPLPYPANALEPSIDARTMEIHHDKHHAAYVKNLNDAVAGNATLEKMSIEDILTKLDQVPEAIRTKVRNNGGGHYNHSLFWQMMTPKQGLKPEGALADGINSVFGSVPKMIEALQAAGLSVFGSGWAWLVKNADGKLAITTTPNQDTPIMNGQTVLLGVDVWEHAYYLKYQNRRGDYLKEWMKVINWPFVQKRLG